MAYVDTNLIPGETVVHRPRLHWIVLAPALIGGAALDLVAFALLVGAFFAHGPKGGVSMPLAIASAVVAVGGSLWVAYAAVRWNATEIAVTSRRVLVKTGLLGRSTTEILLSKIESVAIEETPAGRTLGYGRVMIHGTGGTPEIFDRVAQPNEFRRQVQGQIDALPSNGGLARSA